ncbi:iron uptake porin [Baaleninema sp.]|uniref:iron uptake porin n=1 Tax=Baaleninema sp. TaxID=3101197 RepID=UPI003D046FAE
MNRAFWQLNPISSSILGVFLAATAANAQTTSVDELRDPTPSFSLDQVTSVSQLSDVQPTDWAFQALQSLVERYGCIAGYPDGTYRGNNFMTRYEFAAGVNACLDQIVALIGGGETIDPADLATVRRLQEEFAAELAALRGRVDGLESRTAELEANQFSTTTQLRGEASFSVSSLFGDEKAGGGDIDRNPVLNNRVRLFFNTSFSGRDRLITRLDALNVVPYGPDTTGTFMTRTAFDEGDDNNVRVGKLMYSFPLIGGSDGGHHHRQGHASAPGRLSLVVDAKGGEFAGNFVNFNDYFAEEITGAISRFGRFNPIYYQGFEGTGLSANLRVGDAVTLSAGYLAPEANDPNPKNGLFDGRYAAIAQVAVFPSDTIRFGLNYSRAYYPSGSVLLSGATGSQLANRPFGNSVATSADHFGFQTSIDIASRLTVAGWAGLSLAHAESDFVGVEEGDDATIFNWALTLALPDLGKDGAVGGLIVGQPPRVLDNDGGRDEDDASWHIEAQYRYPVNDNISINPGFFVVLNPENDNDNEALWVTSIRTIFRF